MHVWRSDILIARLKGNDHFGERSLLTDQPVEASCISSTFSDLMCSIMRTVPTAPMM